jgi:hypothetical protein
MRHLAILTAVIVAAAVFPAILFAQAPAQAPVSESDDVSAIKTVIEEAYVKGIHIDQNVEAIRKGFHPAFTMYAYKDGQVTTTSIEQWISSIEEGKKKNPNRPKVETKVDFASVEVSGNAAVARLEMYKDGKHVFTDFMSLYKFDDGWKIVAKIYYRHP